MNSRFDPEVELPVLERWFLQNQRLTHQQAHQYVAELNSLESRRGKTPLKAEDVTYWFMNARATQIRAQTRCRHHTVYQLMNGNNCNNSPSSNEASTVNINPASINEDEQEPQPLSGPSCITPRSYSPRMNFEVRDDNEGGEEGAGNSENKENINNRRTNKDDSQHPPPGIPLSPSSTKYQYQQQQQQQKQQQQQQQQQQQTMTDMAIEWDDAEDLKMENDGQEEVKTVGSGSSRACPGFPLSPNSTFSRSTIMIPAPFAFHHHPQVKPSVKPTRFPRRNYFNPKTEVPQLEEWYAADHNPLPWLIHKYTEYLNQMRHRLYKKNPPLEPHNVWQWFRNQRAKQVRQRKNQSEYTPPTILDGSSVLHPLSNNNLLLPSTSKLSTPGLSVALSFKPLLDRYRPPTTQSPSSTPQPSSLSDGASILRPLSDSNHPPTIAPQPSIAQSSTPLLSAILSSKPLSDTNPSPTIQPPPSTAQSSILPDSASVLLPLSDSHPPPTAPKHSSTPVLLKALSSKPLSYPLPTIPPPLSTVQSSTPVLLTALSSKRLSNNNSPPNTSPKPSTAQSSTPLLSAALSSKPLSSPSHEK